MGRNMTPAENRRAHLKHHYGITSEEYDFLHAAQGGECALCGKTTSDGRGRRLAVDHDHGSGRVRGLLCTGCNVVIGAVERLGSEKIRGYLSIGVSV